MILYRCQEDISILNELIVLAEKYSEGRLLQFQSFVSAYQYRLLYCIFRRYIPQGMKVLDWGVGNGHFSYFLVRSGYKTFGFSLENFPVGVELADAQYHFLRGSVKDPIRLPFKDDSFAAVSSVGVLEHVRQTGGNDEDSMKEIARILKPGGVFVCYHLPNRYSLIEAVARCFPHKYHHQSYYTASTIIALVKRAKLQLVEIKRYGFLPRNIWRYAPGCMKRMKVLARVWDILDMVIAYPFKFLCQNYVFVVRKPVNL